MSALKRGAYRAPSCAHVLSLSLSLSLSLTHTHVRAHTQLFWGAKKVGFDDCIYKIEGSM